MTRILIATALTTVLATGSAAAYQTVPPAKPPAQTTPPPATPPPSLLPPAAQKPPAPVVPFPADAKIGFVSLQAVVAESKLGKAGQTQMKALFDRLNADVAVKQKEVDNLTKDLQTGAALLSAAAQAAKTSLLNQKQRELQFAQDDTKAKMDEFNSNLLDGFSDKVVPIVEELRAEKGLWVIFAVQGADGGLAVLAANPGLDLSAEVTKRLDIKFPGAIK